MRHGPVSRADLLRARSVIDGESLDALAAVFAHGLPVTEIEIPDIPTDHLPDVVATDQVPALPAVQMPESAVTSAYWRIAQRHRVTAEEQERAREVPDFLTEGEPWQQTPTSEGVSPQQRALLSAAKLWPILRRVCRYARPVGQLDFQRLVNNSARLKVATRLPQLRQQRYRDKIHLLMDCRLELQPFQSDFHLMVRELKRWRGQAAIIDHYCDSIPGNRFLADGLPGMDRSRRKWPQHALPRRGETLIVFSDAGRFSGQESEQARAWQAFFASLDKAGVRPVVLSPMPASAQANSAGFTVQFEHLAGSAQPEEQAGAVESLLEMISPLLNVTPALLRDLRQLLSAKKADTHAEFALWNHKRIVRDTIACTVDAGDMDTVHRYRQRFAGLLKSDKAFSSRYRNVLARHRTGVSPLIAIEERVTLDLLEHGALQQPDLINDLEQLSRTLYSVRNTAQLDDLQGYLNRSGARLESAAWADSRLAISWVCANRNRPDNAPKPAGLNVQAIEFLQPQTNEPRDYWLCQHADQLYLSEEALPNSSPLGMISAGRLPVTVEPVGCNGYEAQALDLQHSVQLTTTVGDPANTAEPGLEDETGGKHGPASTADHGEAATAKRHRFRIRSDVDTLILEQQRRPSWATAMHRDKDGLWVTSQTGVSAPWPDWATSFGQDEYGVWATFSVNGVSQKMRWMEPGQFLMGSPVDEEGAVHGPESKGTPLLARITGRESKGTREFERLREGISLEYAQSTTEQLHQVTLTNGYWLADTTCTQALWQAVMKNNPARFGGEKRPVEQVSYNDIEQFFAGLSDLGCAGFYFPTEAQWEYACRAGTTSPFVYGETITTDQANFDGNHPYAGGKKGEYRETTIDVDALPPAKNGLYQMHGNVWEWCADWLHAYSSDGATDPQGPASGEVRVVRGGSWHDGAEFLRSGQRFGDTPEYRNFILGFRLARGQRVASARRNEAAERAESAGNERAE